MAIDQPTLRGWLLLRWRWKPIKLLKVNITEAWWKRGGGGGNRAALRRTSWIIQINGNSLSFNRASNQSPSHFPPRPSPQKIFTAAHGGPWRRMAGASCQYFHLPRWTSASKREEIKFNKAGQRLQAHLFPQIGDSIKPDWLHGWKAKVNIDQPRRHKQRGIDLDNFFFSRLALFCIVWRGSVFFASRFLLASSSGIH